jgi:hypothetical protein
MNPVKFLFESIQFLGFETQILEACDWDEERADFVKDTLQKTLLELTQSPVNSSKPWNKKLSDNLSSSLDEKEVEACLCIIEKCMDSFSQNGDVGYEN